MFDRKSLIGTVKIIRTKSDHPDFIKLTDELDRYLRKVDGDLNEFYDSYNGLENLNHVVLLHDDGIPVACGAMKQYGEDAMEIKRMYTEPSHRRKGFAGIVLDELEKWARELDIKRMILETGLRQQEAIKTYQNLHFTRIPNYGQYAGIDNSLCFEKKLL